MTLTCIQHTNKSKLGQLIDKNKVLIAWNKGLNTKLNAVPIQRDEAQCKAKKTVDSKDKQLNHLEVKHVEQSAVIKKLQTKNKTLSASLNNANKKVIRLEHKVLSKNKEIDAIHEQCSKQAKAPQHCWKHWKNEQSAAVWLHAM